jgi:predicted regulator of Ras-like GTPase activity (Roadblock/LC7/MglB family)
MLRLMDAQQAIADLTEISSQIQAAVVFDDKGTVAGSTFDDPARADELARAAAELLEQADRVKTGDGRLSQLEAATHQGSVFVVRDGKARIAATTAPEPTVGLVFYDLKSALRQVSAAPEPKKRTTRKPAAAAKKTTTTTARKRTAPRRKKTDDAP